MPYKNVEDRNRNARERYHKNKEAIKAKRDLQKDKKNAAAAKYREANRELIRKRDRENRKARIEHYLAVEQSYRDNNREKIRSYYKENIHKWIENKKICDKKYREKNSDFIKEKHREYERKISKNLSDLYVSKSIGLNSKQKKLAKENGFFDELVEVKRLKLLITRELKKEGSKNEKRI